MMGRFFAGLAVVGVIAILLAALYIDFALRERCYERGRNAGQETELVRNRCVVVLR